MGCFSAKGANGFGARTTAEEVSERVDASGHTAIVTGGYKGIGEYTARTLAKVGVHVIIAGRNLKDGTAARDEILKDVPDAKVDVMELDLGSFGSVRSFASDFLEKDLPLNILINNAGIMGHPYSLSEDGIELHFATNHLGHFLLTNLLLDKLKATAESSGVEGRIVNVSSMAHFHLYKDGFGWANLTEKRGFNKHKAYGQSKLANIYHANELARRLKEEGANVRANSLHPGIIHTSLFRHNKVLEGISKITTACGMTKTTSQGAATTCYVALHPNVKGVSGKYFSHCNIAQTSNYAQNAEEARRLWDLSIEMISK